MTSYGNVPVDYPTPESLHDASMIIGERPWFLRESEGDFDPKMANQVALTVQDIEKRQWGIAEGNRRHARLYSGYLPNGLLWGTSPNTSQRPPFEVTRALVRSLCDTATALIVRSRPKSTIVTDGANWKVQRQATDLDHFLVGAYKRGGVYSVAPRCFHDSTVFGTGIWKYVPKGSGEDFYVAAERVFPDDFIVSEEECRDNMTPDNTYHRTLVRTEALMREFAPTDSAYDKELRLRIAASSRTLGWPSRQVPPDRSIVVEAINLPNKRRVLSTGSVTLVDEPWPYDFHPYTWLHWTLPLSGFYGDGICYRQFGRQQRITYLYRWIQKCHDLFSTPRAWVDPAGGIPTLQMSNELGAIITSRKKPEFQTQNTVPTEVYKWLDNLERGGFEDEGISQVTAGNQLPPGIESAPAQREYSFKEGQRFAPISQRWEDAVAVETAEKMTEMYRHHARNGAKPSSKWASASMLYRVDWPDLEKDSYEIRSEASSLESLSPASRAQAALELAQTGWIDMKEGRKLLRHPDLKRSNDLDTSGEEYAEWVLKKLCDGEVVQVDELGDFGSLDRVIRNGYRLAVMAGAPQTILNNIGQYLEELDNAMKLVAEQAVQYAGQQGQTAPSPAMAPSAAPGGMSEPLKG